MRPLISLAASAERCASARTSEATTAKPLPASPARAASTPALRASRLVWNAISSITPMIWPICSEDSAIASIASTACLTTTAPFLASSSAFATTSAACFAPSADFFTRLGDFFERRRGFLQARRLLLGAVREIVRAPKRFPACRSGSRWWRSTTARSVSASFSAASVEIVADAAARSPAKPLLEPGGQIAGGELAQAVAERLHRRPEHLRGARPLLRRTFALGVRRGAACRRRGFDARPVDRVLFEHLVPPWPSRRLRRVARAPRRRPRRRRRRAPSCAQTALPADAQSWRSPSRARNRRRSGTRGRR